MGGSTVRKFGSFWSAVDVQMIVAAMTVTVVEYFLPKRGAHPNGSVWESLASETLECSWARLAREQCVAEDALEAPGAAASSG